MIVGMGRLVALLLPCACAAFSVTSSLCGRQPVLRLARTAPLVATADGDEDKAAQAQEKRLRAERLALEAERAALEAEKMSLELQRLKLESAEEEDRQKIRAQQKKDAEGAATTAAASPPAASPPAASPAAPSAPAAVSADTPPATEADAAQEEPPAAPKKQGGWPLNLGFNLDSFENLTKGDGASMEGLPPPPPLTYGSIGQLAEGKAEDALQLSADQLALAKSRVFDIDSFYVMKAEQTFLGTIFRGNLRTNSSEAYARVVANAASLPELAGFSFLLLDDPISPTLDDLPNAEERRPVFLAVPTDVTVRSQSPLELVSAIGALFITSVTTLGFVLSTFILADGGQMLEQLEQGETAPIDAAAPIALGIGILFVVHEVGRPAERTRPPPPRHCSANAPARTAKLSPLIDPGCSRARAADCPHHRRAQERAAHHGAHPHTIAAARHLRLHHSPPDVCADSPGSLRVRHLWARRRPRPLAHCVLSRNRPLH